MAEKDLEVKEFSSIDDMLAYEKERERYLASRMVSNCGLFKFYYYEFLDTFIPKYRKIIKEYKSYLAGYWKNNDTFFSTYPLSQFPNSIFKNGDIFVQINPYDKDSILDIHQYTCLDVPMKRIDYWFKL